MKQPKPPAPKGLKRGLMIGGPMDSQEHTSWSVKFELFGPEHYGEYNFEEGQWFWKAKARPVARRGSAPYVGRSGVTGY